MNVDNSPNSASPGPAGPPTSRAQRGAIASQACETCRGRKQKCDEVRPKCGLCRRMNLDCNYREPTPTKKDKTLVEILERLARLEGKVDRIPKDKSPGPPGFGPPQQSPRSRPSFSNDHDGSRSTSSLPSTRQASSEGQRLKQPYRHASAAHKILAWPAIQQLMLQVLPANTGDLRFLEQDGSQFIIRIFNGQPRLNLEEALIDRPFLGMQSQASRIAGGPRITFPDLTREHMHQLTTAYFDNFNLLYPFMDRRAFESDTLVRVLSEGFDGDVDSVVALLIFALGEVALEGISGPPIGHHNGLPSGIRGGKSATRPPGLNYFNEARKSLGFVFGEHQLVNVQIFSLAALYFQACCRYVDFWRMTGMASQACHILVTCNVIDYNTQKGDLIRRALWHCIIMETSLHLDLDVQPSGIVHMGDEAGMPSFNTPFCEADHRSNQATNFEAHFASALALRRLCASLNSHVYEASSNGDTPRSDESGIPSADFIKSLASQLEQWRGMLPHTLQWPEDDPAAYPSARSDPAKGFERLDPALNAAQQSQPRPPLFTTDLSAVPMQYPYVYDVQVAFLRTRYYYVKYMLYRPFVYKALHFPELMTQDDAEGVAEFLTACLRWPLTMSPTSRHKRLVPWLFCWSQTFLSILLIFHLTHHNPVLRSIRAQYCGPRFEADFDISVALMQDWIRDLKSIDPLAQWCYNILQPIYNLDH